MLAACAAIAVAARSRAQAPREIVDSAGRRVRLPAQVERVFAAGPPASVVAFAVAPDKLVGWTTPFRPDERPFVAPKYANLPALGRLTGRASTANVEVVLGAKPDLVFDYGASNPTFASLADRVQRQTGIPYVLLDGAFDATMASLRTFGEIVGERERGDALARYAAAAIDEVTRRVARIPADRRPRIYYGRGPRGLDTGLAGSINMEIIERMGAVNVAAELGRGGLVQVSLEQVLHWNPDVILTTDPTFFASVRRDPLWQNTAAVRAGRVHIAPAVPFGWIDFPPSINRLIGLRWLGRLLYPDAFPEDLGPIVREFYVNLYHQTPTDAQLAQLIATAQPMPALR